jgi:hypothetical protein
MLHPQILPKTALDKSIVPHIPPNLGYTETSAPRQTREFMIGALLRINAR